MHSDNPLLERLVTELNYPVATPDNLPALIAEHPTLVLFFAGNPTRFPESNDVAVILPEIVRAFANEGLTAAIAAEQHEGELKSHYPFDIWPALVFLKQGFHIGSICKVQDWADYRSQIASLLSANKHLNSAIPTQTLAAEV